MKRYKQSVIPQASSEWDGTTLTELKKIAKSYYVENLLGKKVINEHTGVTIEFAKSGISHVLYFGRASFVKLKAVQILDKLIKVAEFKNFKNPDASDGRNIVGFMIFEAKAKIEEETRNIRMIIRITNEGKFHYHHSEKIV